MGGFYILLGSNLEKCGIVLKNGRFSGRIWPDWGNTTRAHLAGLGSIGLRRKLLKQVYKITRKNGKEANKEKKTTEKTSAHRNRST